MDQPRISSLLIKPAGPDCNMACRYCFYRPVARLYPQTRQPRMSAELLRELVRQFMAYSWHTAQAGGPAQAAFCWQGGEPTLLGIDFYRLVVALQQQYGHSGQIVGNSLQTNGLLLNDEWARFLARYRFLVGLSLDGPPEIHDFYRRQHGGEPSHALVVRAWRLLREHNVETNILCMATAHSADKAPLLFHYLYELGVRFMQFIPCVEWDARTGQPLPYTIPVEAYGDFLCALFDSWLPYQHDVSIRFFDDLLCRLIGREELVSCEFRAACGDYLVVEHNGDLYTCDFFVDRAHYIGNLQTHSLAEATTSALFRSFAAAKRQLAPVCLECRWQRFCWGGCQKHRRFGGRALNSPTYLCAAYRRFFAHALPTLERIAQEMKAACPPPSLHKTTQSKTAASDH